MKRVALSALLSVAMVAAAAAQTSTGSTPSGSSSQNPSSTPSTSSDQSTGATSSTAPASTSAENKSAENKSESGKKAKLTGCVQSQGGGYALVDKKYPNGVQLLSSEDLSAHVGHKVEVKGTWEAASSASASGSSASGSSAGTGSSSASSLPQSDAGANQAVRVSEIKMKSDKCENASGSTPKY